MLTFPTHLFNPPTTRLRPAGAVLTGGESLSGEVDTIRTDGGGYWVIEMEGIPLNTDDKLRAWQAWEDILEGGVTQVLVPVPELRLAPRPVIGGALGRPSQLESTSDDPYFPEALAFATPWIVARIIADAALRATELVIDVESGARLKGGERFSIDHPTAGRRLYRIARVTARNGQEATVTIRPPLREAVEADPTPVDIDFDWPSVVATLMPEADISPGIENGRSAFVGITFRESFQP